MLIRRSIALLAVGFFTLGVVAQATADGESPDAARWYKGNTHTHSLWSDGNDFPEMVVDWYRAHGYDFLCLSDHNILSDHEYWMTVADVVKRAGGDDVMTKYQKRFPDAWVETREQEGQPAVRLKRLDEFRPLFEKPGEFLLVQAEEITDKFGKKQVHINAVNLDELISPQHGDSVRDTMRRNLQAVRAQEEKLGRPILAHLNHPNYQWSITAEDLAHVLEDKYFEVYNGHPGAAHMGDEHHAGDERLWDIANTIRLGELNAPPLMCVATDDAHDYHGRKDATPGRGWVMVRSPKLDADALMTAMRAGDFYASSGVTLRDVQFSPESGIIKIEIEPAGDAKYTTQFIGTRTGYNETSKPVMDAEGAAVDCTRRYSGDVGEVLATVRGPRAAYKLKGDELYVRATITSTQPAENPSFEGQLKQAWTQPVGWKIEQPGTVPASPE